MCVCVYVLCLGSEIANFRAFPFHSFVLIFEPNWKHKCFASAISHLSVMMDGRNSSMLAEKFIYEVKV